VAHLATLNAKEEGWCLDKALAEHVEEYKQDNTAKNFADVLWLSEAVEVNAGTSLYYAHVLSQHDASAAVPLTEEQEEFNRQIEARLDELVARLLSTGSLLRKTAEPCDTAEEVEEEEDTQDHEQLCEGGDHCGILHSHPSGYCDLCRMDQQK
jgi:proteasome lid subunit RPN8/RPN11